jgi:carboxyl-terminal processing protease
MKLNEKLYVLSTVWSQLKFCFANFEKVPEFDPDREFINALDLISNGDMYDFYKILARFVAKAKDTHTQVIPCEALYNEIFCCPPVSLVEAEGKAWVRSVAAEFASVLPLGSEILSIDGVPLMQYLESTIFPQVMTSERMLLSQGIGQCLYGKKNTKVSIGYTDKYGNDKSIIFDRFGSNDLQKMEFANLLGFSSNCDFEFKNLSNDIFYIAANTFSNRKFLDEIDNYLMDIDKAKSVIIDLRYNGGGNSTYGEELLRYFISEEKVIGISQIKQFIPCYETVKKYFPEAECDYELEDYPWIKSKATIKPNQFLFSKPVYILQSRNTASAAEDFIAAAKNFKNFITIGENTNGGTGTQIFTDLGHGLTLRVCCKRDLTSDGYDYSRWGFAPDVLIERKIKDLIENRDVVLSHAIEIASNA